MDIQPEPPSSQPFLTVAEFWASVRAAAAGLVVGGMATAVLFLLGILAGYLFLTPEPDGTPDVTFEGRSSALFFLSGFSIVAAAFWPNKGKPLLAAFLLLVLFSVGFLAADDFVSAGADAEILLPLGLVTGLVALMFHQFRHYGNWPPYRPRKLFLRRVVVAPVGWTMFCTLFLFTCYPCNSGPSGSVEKAGNEHLRNAVAYYLEHGQAPPNFRSMGPPQSTRGRHGWILRTWGDLFHVSVEYGDYSACGWEVSGSIGATWNPACAKESAELRSEAHALMRLVFADWLEVGTYAGNMETLGLPSDWGELGPWRLRENAARQTRFGPQELLLERKRSQTSGEPEWQWVINMRTVHWYHDR